ncbi:Uncharacterized protein OBRU01_00585 [Operophtera brumata]|uniref:Uncharacterized protein n=1 Tax=Operophtera brumata TaxID=104452 RepID=A0A0L7LV03_OPEBR|nr:Uncharacterized protein OBRU01_00585 [Operophtera brumata]
MYLDSNRMLNWLLVLALTASSEAFFLKWGSDSSSIVTTAPNFFLDSFELAKYVICDLRLIIVPCSSRQASPQKSWVQPMSPNMSPSYRYQYAYSPYDARKFYQIQNPQYAQAEMQNIQNMQMQQNLAPIPISMPAGASLTPVSLQHVQLVPCMCPVAPEEAEKLQDQVGPGPYIAQTFAQQSYSVPQQMTVAADNSKSNNKQ